MGRKIQVLIEIDEDNEEIDFEILDDKHIDAETLCDALVSLAEHIVELKEAGELNEAGPETKDLN